MYAVLEARHVVTAADCPFCRPDPARIAWSDSPLVLALWDGFPVSPGHALVVPRRHAAGWADLTAAEQQALLAAIDPVRALIATRHAPDGFNVGFNDGAAAGQTVPHFHLHVIPRYARRRARSARRRALGAAAEGRVLAGPGHVSERAIGELEFLRKLQRLLAEGDFVATYKLALLNALADLSVEGELARDGSLHVPIEAIAEKFIAYYWPQARPYRAGDGAGFVLRQNAGKQAAVINALTAMQGTHATLAAARSARGWRALVRDVGRTIVTMPLWKLQTVGSERDEFLYRQAEYADESIRLLPGVPQAFRALYGLVLDAVRGAWVRQITRIGANRMQLADADLATFLFGSERGSLEGFARVLREHQHGRCLYCRREIRSGGDVDHFIAWSRYPVDLGHNLVLAHQRLQRQEARLPRAPRAPRALAAAEHGASGRARAALRRRAAAVRHGAHARDRVVGVRARRAGGGACVDRGRAVRTARSQLARCARSGAAGKGRRGASAALASIGNADVEEDGAAIHGTRVRTVEFVPGFRASAEVQGLAGISFPSAHAHVSGRPIVCGWSL